MNRILNLWPAIIIAAPIAFLLLLFGVERLSLKGSRVWVKLALAVNTCLLLFTGIAYADDGYPQIDCYEIGYVPDSDPNVKPEIDPLIQEFNELNNELNRLIDSGFFSETEYSSIRDQIEERITVLVAAGAITSDEADQVRAYFRTRLDIYSQNEMRPMCYRR